MKSSYWYWFYEFGTQTLNRNFADYDKPVFDYDMSVPRIGFRNLKKKKRIFWYSDWESEETDNKNRT